MILGTVRRRLIQMTKRSSSSSLATPRWNYRYDEKSLGRKGHLTKEEQCGGLSIRETQRDLDVWSYVADCCGNGCSGCEVFASLKVK